MLAAVAVALFLGHCWHYYPFFADDAFISLRYSQRLLHGHGLTWTDGRPVEGYTNLLWVLACAAMGAAHVDLIWAARLIGVVSVLAIFAAVIIFHRKRGPWCCAVGLFSLALCGPVCIWAIGGLEQAMLGALLAWAFVFTIDSVGGLEKSARTPFVAGAFLALATLCRADAVLFAGLFSLSTLLVTRPTRSGLLIAIRLATLPAIALVGQLIFRRIYYGEWLPNTAYVKIAFTLDRVYEGLRYAGKGATALSGIIALSVGALIRRKSQAADRPWSNFILICVAGWVGYVIFIGGDIFPGFRHLIPAIVLLAFLAPLLVDHRHGSRGEQQVSAAIAMLSLWLVLIGNTGREAVLATEERWEWEGKEVGNFLKTAFGDKQPLLCSDPAGCVPYFSELPAIDPMGLCDYHIARHHDKDFGHGGIGHELGDGAYILDHKPDLVIFTLPLGTPPFFNSARQIATDPRFSQFYTLMPYRTRLANGLRGSIWIRKTDGPLGIVYEPDRVIIPGYLATASSGSFACLDEAGHIAAYATPTEPAAIFRVRIPFDRFTISVDSSALVTAVSIPAAELGCFDVTIKPLATSFIYRIELRKTTAANAR